MLGSADPDDERRFATPAFGAAYGLIAGVTMVVATVAARVIWGSITVTELAADWFTETISPEAIDFLLSLLSTTAKPLMFAGLLVAQVVDGVGLGAGYTWLARHRPLSGAREWGHVAGLSATLWLAGMVTIVPLFGGGFLGLNVRGGACRSSQPAWRPILFTAWCWATCSTGPPESVPRCHTSRPGAPS